MAEAFDWVIEHWAFSAFCLTCLIQITPVIKWNPLTALFSWIGSLVTAPVRNDLSGVRQELTEIKGTQADQQRAFDESEKNRIRWEVFQFAASCRAHEHHSLDEFQHIIARNDEYHALLQKTGDTNGVYDAEYKFILKLYQERQEKNDFA